MHAPTPPPLSDDDERWLAALSSQSADNADGASAHILREADCLSNALRAQESLIDARLAPVLARGPDALIDYLRQNALLKTETAQTKTDRSSLWFTSWGLLSALAMLLIVVILPPLFFERTQLPLTASADQQAFVMRVDNPYRHAQLMANDIRQVGGKAHIRKQVNGHVMLYAEATPEVMAQMRQHNMNPPVQHGMVVIAFIPMQESPAQTKSTT